MLYEDPRNRCCCAIHVVTGANIIGGFGVVVSLCLLIICLLYTRWLLAIGPLLLCCAYASVFYAFHMRHYRIYWPFLLMNGLAVAGGSIFILTLSGMFLVNPDFWQRFMNEFTDYEFQDSIHQYPRLITGGIAVVMLVVQVVNIWFELVVYNASTFLRREQGMTDRQATVYKV